MPPVFAGRVSQVGHGCRQAGGCRGCGAARAAGSLTTVRSDTPSTRSTAKRREDSAICRSLRSRRTSSERSTQTDIAAQLSLWLPRADKRLTHRDRLVAEAEHERFTRELIPGRFAIRPCRSNPVPQEIPRPSSQLASSNRSSIAGSREQPPSPNHLGSRALFDFIAEAIEQEAEANLRRHARIPVAAASTCGCVIRRRVYPPAAIPLASETSESRIPVMEGYVPSGKPRP
jgi:hypothetical protein